MVDFRRISGTSVVGDIAFENIALAPTNYAHTSLTGDPALAAAGKGIMYSSGFSAGRRYTTNTGLVYSLAGGDNPEGTNNLLGAGTGREEGSKNSNLRLTGGAGL